MIGSSYTFRPLIPERWHDFVTLFSEHGVQNGCWCMYWRLSREQYRRHFGWGNNAAFKKVVLSRMVPGIIAYHKGKPVGWCAVSPRDEYPSLNRSPTLKRIDDKPVWSITCFFVSKQYRGKGLNGLLVQAAVEYVRKHGGRIVEAYPVRANVKPATMKWEKYTGMADTFKRLGFKTVSRRSKIRLVMRYYLAVAV